MATLELNDFPSVMMAVQRIASPVNITITAATFSQVAPPNMFFGPVSLIQLHAVMEVKMTIHRISKEPRSRTLPLLCLVRVAMPMIISEANHPQKSASQRADSVIAFPNLEAARRATIAQGFPDSARLRG